MNLKAIPEQLCILLHTDVPGYQEFVFEPRMLVPSLREDDVVLFNPLVELNKASVEQIPEAVRIKQFFNKGLFKSMLNYMRGERAATLDQAVERGYIDKNIQVTLSILFAKGNVLYIEPDKPHVIVNHNWTEGDWRVDLKLKLKEMVPNKMSPLMQHYDLQQNVKIGEQQLDAIPAELMYGPGYTGKRTKKASTAAPDASSASASASPEDGATSVATDISNADASPMQQQQQQADASQVTETGPEVGNAVPEEMDESSYRQLQRLLSPTNIPSVHLPKMQPFPGVQALLPSLESLPKAPNVQLPSLPKVQLPSLSLPSMPSLPFLTSSPNTSPRAHLFRPNEVGLMSAVDQDGDEALSSTNTAIAAATPSSSAPTRSWSPFRSASPTAMGYTAFDPAIPIQQPAPIQKPRSLSPFRLRDASLLSSSPEESGNNTSSTSRTSSSPSTAFQSTGYKPFQDVDQQQQPPATSSSGNQWLSTPRFLSPKRDASLLSSNSSQDDDTSLKAKVTSRSPSPSSWFQSRGYTKMPADLADAPPPPPVRKGNQPTLLSGLEEDEEEQPTTTILTPSNPLMSTSGYVRLPSEPKTRATSSPPLLSPSGVPSSDDQTPPPQQPSSNTNTSSSATSSEYQALSNNQEKTVDPDAENDNPLLTRAAKPLTNAEQMAKVKKGYDDLFARLREQEGGAFNFRFGGPLYKNENDSKLCYVVPLYMQLYPGTDLTPEQWTEANCSHNANMMKKSWAELMNQSYRVVPVYERRSAPSAVSSAATSSSTKKGGHRQTKKNQRDSKRKSRRKKKM